MPWVNLVSRWWKGGGTPETDLGNEGDMEQQIASATAYLDGPKKITLGFGALVATCLRLESDDIQRPFEFCNLIFFNKCQI